MSLFEARSLKRSTKTEIHALSHVVPSAVHLKLSAPGKSELAATLSELKPESVVHYVTYGKWSLHQLIAHLVQRTGPSDLYLTTWSMTEDPVRTLLMLKKSGKLKHIACLLSERISERTPQVMQLATSVFDQLKLYKSHAKSFVLIGEKLSLVGIGSANLTRNRKNEIGILDTSESSVKFHLNWMKKELNKKAPHDRI